MRDGEVRVGIRPEHFAIGGGEPGLELAVEVVENLGGTRYVYGTLPSNEEIIVEARDHVTVKAGETVTVGYRPERVLAFLPDGERLRAGA